MSYLIEANSRKSKLEAESIALICLKNNDLAEESSKGRKDMAVSYLLATSCEDSLYPSRCWPFALALTFCSGICESNRLQISDAIEDTECQDGVNLVHDGGLRGEVAVWF